MAGAGPVLIRREDFGDIVCHPWYAIAASAANAGILIAVEDRSVPKPG